MVFGYYYGNNLITQIFQKIYNSVNTTIVIANQSIISQWLTELEKSTLKVGKITRTKHIEQIDIEANDVILLSPTMYNKFVQRYQNYAWKRFIFDEPSHTKISAMKETCSWILLVSNSYT